MNHALWWHTDWLSLHDEDYSSPLLLVPLRLRLVLWGSEFTKLTANPRPKISPCKRHAFSNTLGYLGKHPKMTDAFCSGKMEQVYIVDHPDILDYSVFSSR